jgi:hypothetical protein
LAPSGTCLPDFLVLSPAQLFGDLATGWIGVSDAIHMTLHD